MSLAAYTGSVELDGLLAEDAGRVLNGLAQALDSARCDSSISRERTLAWRGDLFFRSGNRFDRRFYGGAIEVVEGHPLSVHYRVKAGWIGDMLRFGVPYALTALILQLILRDAVITVSLVFFLTFFSVLSLQRQRRARLPLAVERMALDWRDRAYLTRVSTVTPSAP